MIKFDNWRILNQGKVLARQYDNLTRELRVEGIIPEGWTWDLLVQAGKNLDIIRLNQGENSLSVILTSEMLALSGYYALQLRATQGEKVRHTNVLRVYVPESLSGNAQWPELPTEFSQAEAIIRELNAHPPIPGNEGFWMVWNTETDQYEKSSLPLPAGSGGGYVIGSGLKLDGETNTLSVDTADQVEADNSKPITSAAVFVTVGNIESLLETI